MVQNYQKEEEKWYEPSAEEESTTEPDFVENMWDRQSPLYNRCSKDKERFSGNYILSVP